MEIAEYGHHSWSRPRQFCRLDLGRLLSCGAEGLEVDPHTTVRLDFWQLRTNLVQKVGNHHQNAVRSRGY